MKKVVLALAFVLAFAAGAFGLYLYDAAFARPLPNPQPLPDALIAGDSQAGRELLANNIFAVDYPRLAGTFEPQARPAYCGVASSVAVLNALNPAARLTQETFFEGAAGNVRGALEVTLGGMTLPQLAELLRAHGAQADVFHASGLSVDAFRGAAIANLRTQGDYLLVNYARGELGQGDYGHISPVAAYNAVVDRMLVLDVAAYHWPPVWVRTADLWKAMNTIDPDSGLSRGYIVVRGVTGPGGS